MTYLAVARITVDDPVHLQIRDLRDGLERVVHELHDRGISVGNILDDVEDVLDQIQHEESHE